LLVCKKENRVLNNNNDIYLNNNLGLGRGWVGITHVTLAFGPCRECAIFFKKIRFRHFGVQGLGDLEHEASMVEQQRLMVDQQGQ
jgi:hypothetical protein